MPDSTVSGPQGKWTSACTTCLSGDWLEVRNGKFEARDVNDWAWWMSEWIDITGCNDVHISVEASESGDHEGPGCGCNTNIDYFDLQYQLDGNGWNTIANWNGDGTINHTLTGDSLNGVYNDSDWVSTKVLTDTFVGDSVRIRVLFRNSEDDEVIRLDQVVVNAACALHYQQGEVAGAASSDVRSTLYPNPVKDELHIWLPEESLVRIFDAVGRMKLERQLSERENTISVSEWQVGTYFVYIRRAESTERFVFQKIR